MPVRLSKLALRLSLSASIAIVALTPSWLSAQEKDGAGAVISGKATPKDVGLPIYPGSMPHKDKVDDSTAANLGLWGGGAGFKLAVLKMESSDSPEKIAAYYKKALSKYGPVLDCSNASLASKLASKNDSSDALTCDDDKSEKGGFLFKAGTKSNHRLVAIQPDGHGSLYQVVNIGSWSKK
jgi:hypothetical protein